MYPNRRNRNSHYPIDVATLAITPAGGIAETAACRSQEGVSKVSTTPKNGGWS